MAFTFTTAIDDMDWHALAAMYQRAPLGHKDPDKLRTVFEHSLFRCFVHDDAKPEAGIIGAGRALADGADCAYICDVALLPEYQGQGLGRAIVQRLMQAAQGHKKIILYSVPGKEGFYRSLGFARMTTAMARFDNQDLYLEQGYLSDT